MKAQRYIKTGAIAYQGIMAQVQAEREAQALEAQAKPLPRVPLAAVWTPRGHESYHRKGSVRITYVVRLAPHYSRASFTYEG